MNAQILPRTSKPPTRTQTRRLRPRSSHAALAIAIVFSLGASVWVPMDVAAQVNGGLHGTVMDTDGIALSDVEISARKIIAGDTASFKDGASGADGTYRLDGLSAGDWNVTFLHDGYGKHNRIITISAGQDTLLDVILAPSWATRSEVVIQRTVLDADTELPIKNAEVTVTGFFKQGPSKSTTTTNDAGKFSIRLFEGENHLQITRRGYERYNLWFYSQGTTFEGDKDGTIMMRSVPIQDVTIKGTVVDGQGNPIQAWIDLQTDWRSYEAQNNDQTSEARPAIEPAYCCDDRQHQYNQTTTKSDGTFTLKAYPGPVILRANRAESLVSEKPLSLEKGQSYTLQFTLVALPAKDVTIEGRVTDLETGEPIRGADVNAQVPGAADYEWTRTDENGRYTFKLRPGYTILEVRHWGHIYYHDDVAAMEAEPASADAAPEGGGESGSDASGSQSEEPASAPAEPEPASRSSMIAPAPTSQGIEYYPSSMVLTTSAGDRTTMNVKLEPKPAPTVTLIGYVVDRTTNLAVAGASVNYQNLDTNDWAHAQTDEDGSFTFTVRPGKAELRVWHDSYYQSTTQMDIPDVPRMRRDLQVQPGTQANAGWWDPSRDGECCYAYAEEASEGDQTVAPGAPRPATAPQDASAESSSRSASAGASGGSGRQLAGGPGGLGPYDGGDTDDPIIDGEPNREFTPAPGALLVVALIGLLAIVVGLRREGPRRPDQK